MAAALERSRGHRFSDVEINLLIDRVARFVGSVKSHWNGVGTMSFSVLLEVPVKKLSDEQVAGLMAPLSEG